jgi:hypothetical protein
MICKAKSKKSQDLEEDSTTLTEQDSTSLTMGEVTEKTEYDTDITDSKELIDSTIDPTLENDLIQYDLTIIKKSETSKSLTKEQAILVLKRIQTYKGIGRKTTVQAIAALFRKGAANAGATDTMKVDVRCPETGVTVEVNRYDIVMALQQVVGHKNVRKLAEAMAPEMLSAYLRIIKANPLLDLKGDIANRINRKLNLRKEDPLTREEEVCCCTYSQWMPNLNEMANSKRLKGLLDEDLNARRKKTAKKADKKNIKKDSK